MRIKDYLKNDKEPIPNWLSNHRTGDKINIQEALSHRILYYPGAYDDGGPIRAFNKANHLHTFFYVDYLMDEADLRKRLTDENAFAGYTLIDIQDLTPKELVPDGWTQHFTPTREHVERMPNDAQQNTFGLIAIFERQTAFDDSHGAKRFALIYLKSDGIATYDAVFANYKNPPQVLVLQDHGFGGGYAPFGNEGPLVTIANKTNCYPNYIFCAENTFIWDGYEKVKGLFPEINGMHHMKRRLYEKRKTKKFHQI